MNMAVTVAVATGNITKLQAVFKAFKRYYNTVDVVMVEVDSNVSRQPVNEEIMHGAENRVKNAKKAVTQRKYNYFVACEGGMICQYGKWFNQQVVLIEDEFGKQSWGLSQSFPIPEKYVKEAKETSIAKVLDSIFDGRGGISMLTHGAMNREYLVEMATIMALTGVINEEIW